MNNCPKCGNPLEPGVTTCPICGNNINNNLENSTSVSQTSPETANPSSSNNMVSLSEMATSSVPNPVAEPAQAQTPESPAPTVTEASSNQNGGEQPVQTSTPNPTPASNPTVAIAPVPTPEPTPTPVVVEPPKIVVEPTNHPNIPTPNAPNTPLPSEPNPNKPLVTDEKPKNKKSKTLLILIAVIGIIAIVGIGLSLNLGGPKAPPAPTVAAIETTAVTSNGYKFNLPSTWLLAEDSENVVITNEDNTISIKFDHSTTTISNIDESIIQKVISSHQEYTNTEITKTKISAKDAYLVNTTINNMPVQIYFINGGSNLMLGVSIIYQSNESKEKYEATVTEMIGTLSYADESLKALNTINMYSNIFNLYNSISNYHEPTNNIPEDNESNSNGDEQLPQNPEDNNENNDNNGVVDQNTPNPENPVNPN